MLRLPYTNAEYEDKPVKAWRLKSIRQRSTTKRFLIVAGILLIFYILFRLYDRRDGNRWADESGEDDLFVESEWHSTGLARSLMNARGSLYPGRRENVYFLLNELVAADGNLVALGCDMSVRQEGSKVHFIILGVGRLGIEEYRKMNRITDESCVAHFHDARVPPGDDTRRSNKLVSFATNAISLIVEIHSPQAILYTHSPERPKPTWFTSSIQMYRHRTTFIELAQSSVTSLDWIATLSAQSLRDWHRPRIDVLVDAGTDAGSLHRLFASLSRAHYPNNHRPLIMLDYDATLVSGSTYDFAESLSRIWPPDKLILKSRTSGNREAPFEAWYPVSPDAHLLLLRDTDEVSPLYYDYLLKTILSHRYSGSESRMASVLGVTLRSARDDQGKIRSGNGDVGTPTLLFPNHFTAFHRTLRQADTSVGPGADQVGAWRRYVREHQLVVITPAAIEHEDDTFVFVKDFTGDRTITVDEPIKNTGPRLLDDPGWWRSIGPDQFVDGIV